MTVRELIVKLASLDQNAVVLVQDGSGFWPFALVLIVATQVDADHAVDSSYVPRAGEPLVALDITADLADDEVVLSQSCSWCHRMNVVRGRTSVAHCPGCGHRADCARMNCDCRQCVRTAG